MKKEITLEDLAVMIGKGFNETTDRFNKIEKRMTGLESEMVKMNKRMDRVESEMKGIRTDLKGKANLTDLLNLERRVNKLEASLQMA